MSNAPLRVAFWTMCCACTATFVVIALSPDAARFVNTLAGKVDTPPARHSSEIQPDLPLVVLGAEQPLIVPVITDAPASRSVPDPYQDAGLVQHDASAWPAQYSPPPAAAVRTASANPALILGPIEPEEEEQPSRPVSQPVTSVAAVDVPAVSIPVPQPEEIVSPPARLADVYPEPRVTALQTDITGLRVAQLEREIAEARSIERGKLQELADRELSTIGGRLQKFRESYRELTPPHEPAQPVVAAQSDAPAIVQPLVAPVPAFTGTAHESTDAPSASQSVADAGSIRITPSVRKERHDVTIADARISDLLSQLARELGWPIIVRPEVTGTFSGEFVGADLQQVFAIVVKANELRLERRGNYLIIGNR